MMMMVRGVRGATTAAANDADSIRDAAYELMQALIAANEINQEHVASVMFTTTPDLNATFPAAAARLLGWTQVALLGAQEIDCPNGVPLCIRVLIHWNTEKSLSEIRHVYMHGAQRLRPDLYPDNKIVIEDEGAPLG